MGPFAQIPGANGAGDGTRTRDFDLGKVALYQLSYSRALTFKCTALRARCQLDPRLDRAVDFKVLQAAAERRRLEPEAKGLAPALAPHVLSLLDAWPGRRVRVTDAGALDVAHGRPVSAAHVDEGKAPLEGAVVGLVHQLEGEAAELIGLGRWEGDDLRVVRGIRPSGEVGRADAGAEVLDSDPSGHQEASGAS